MFEKILTLLAGLKNYVPALRTVILVVFIFVIFTLAINWLRRILLKRARTKKQISNVEIFSRIIKYLFYVLVIIIAIFSYSGSWSSLGLTVGLLSAALGWALQKPITGIAGWIMVVTKRPFEIGDRIIIGGVRGDVSDITLTHVYLKEIGGIATSEENSGRIIMVPNSILFEQNIINYTLQDDYILDEVVVAITYKSNLDKAMEICKKAAKSLTKDYDAITNNEPYIRTYFQQNGINIHIRYFAPAKVRQKVSSEITQEIFKQIKNAKDIHFAYQHTEIIWDKK